MTFPIPTYAELVDLAPEQKLELLQYLRDLDNVIAKLREALARRDVREAAKTNEPLASACRIMDEFSKPPGNVEVKPR